MRDLRSWITSSAAALRRLQGENEQQERVAATPEIARRHGAVAAAFGMCADDLDSALTIAGRPLRETLKALEKVFPPPPGQHHALTFCRYGSDATGWEDKLALRLRGPGADAVTTFFVEDHELQQPVDELVAAIENSRPLAKGPTL